jgi:hypothetical protein
MVEMSETANILHHASPDSLVLMDEIGRGTSTFDGLSLAWSVAIALASECQCMSLFATHYFELTQLATDYDGIANVHLDAIEHGDQIVFLHALREGPASQSYGLQVAALAGVPKHVVQRARQRLKLLEQQASGRHDSPQTDLFTLRLQTPSWPGMTLMPLIPDQPGNCCRRCRNWIWTNSARARHWTSCMNCGNCCKLILDTKIPTDLTCIARRCSRHPGKKDPQIAQIAQITSIANPAVYNKMKPSYRKCRYATINYVYIDTQRGRYPVSQFA